jgi:hypothetical protein
MSDEEIQDLIEDGLRAHELTHKSLELSGENFPKDETYGMSKAAWERQKESFKRSVAHEVAAYSAQMVYGKNPKGVLVHLLPHLFMGQGTPEDITARYIFTTLAVGNELRQKDDPEINFINANLAAQVLIGLAQLTEPELKKSIKKIILDIFDGINFDQVVLNNMDQMPGDNATLGNKNELNILERERIERLIQTGTASSDEIRTFKRDRL